MRLIDADLLLEEIKELHIAILGNPNQTVVGNEYKKSISRLIDEQPTVGLDGKTQIEHKVIQNVFNISSEGKSQRSCSAETFKQFVFDIAVEVEQKSKEEIRDRLLDLVHCFYT